MKHYLVLLLSLLLFTSAQSQSFGRIDNQYYGQIWEVVDGVVEEYYSDECQVIVSETQVEITSTRLTGGVYYFTVDNRYFLGSLFTLESNSDYYTIYIDRKRNGTIMFEFQDNGIVYFFMGYQY